MKKFLAMLIAVLLTLSLGVVALAEEHEHNFTEAAGTYPVWVKEILVTDENKDDILDDGGSVRYVPEEKTLYLNNAVFGEAYHGIYAKEDLTVEYTGTNIIGPNMDTHITVWAEKSLTLKGVGNDASLTLASDFGGIATQKKLTLDGGSVNVLAITYAIIANTAGGNDEVGFEMTNNAAYYAGIEHLDTERDNSALVYVGTASIPEDYTVLGSSDSSENISQASLHTENQTDKETQRVMTVNWYYIAAENPEEDNPYNYVKTIFIDKHIHNNWETEYTIQGDWHWLKCAEENCNAIKPGSLGKHKVTLTCTEGGICEVCGNEYGPLGHNFMEGPWMNDDADGHYKKCTACDVTDKDRKFPHEYSDSTDATCNACGYERDIPSKDFPSNPPCDHDLDANGKCKDCGVVIITYVDGKPSVPDKVEEENPNTGAESAVAAVAAVAVVALAGAVISKKR